MTVSEKTLSNVHKPTARHSVHIRRYEHCHKIRYSVPQETNCLSRVNLLSGLFLESFFFITMLFIYTPIADQL